MAEEEQPKPHLWVDLILRSASQPDEESAEGYLRPGQTCPNCGFAALREDELGNLSCPVCGFGVVRPCT